MRESAIRRRPPIAPLLVAALVAGPSGARTGAVPAPPEGLADRVLADVADGLDRRDEALFVLLDEVRAGDGPGDTPAAAAEVPVVRAALLAADPAGRRGDPGRLDGVLQQTSTLDGPGGALVEWFLRDRDGSPVAFVMPVDFAPDARAGERVRAVGRFWKVVEVAGRDGRARSHPVLVGRGLRLEPPPVGGLGLAGPAGAVLLGGLLAAWFGLRAVATRARRDEPRAASLSGAVVGAGAASAETAALALARAARGLDPSIGPAVDVPIDHAVENDDADTPAPVERPAQADVTIELDEGDGAELPDDPADALATLAARASTDEGAPRA